MTRRSTHRSSLIHYPNFLTKLIGKTNPVVLEVGCNDGQDTLELVKLFPSGTFHCFDPEPRAIESWKRQDFGRHLNGGSCSIYPVALSCQIGTSVFHQSSGTTKGAYKSDWDLSGSLNKPTGHLQYSPWVKFESEIEVETTTLDCFIKEKRVEEVDLLWMDVQGGERNVLEGAKETLSKTRLLYTEYNHVSYTLYEGGMTLTETINYLGKGWKMIGLFEGCNVLLERKS